MEVNPLRSLHAKEAILAVACIALALCCISCGGAGSTQVAPAATTAGFSLSSASIAFANQDVGTASTPESATLTNVGNASLTISSIKVAGSDAADFALTSNCGSLLAPSGQCTIAVTFKPSSTGTRAASIAFADNADGSPQTVSLSGTGIAPAISLSSTSLSFGSEAVASTSAFETVTLTNTGNGSLTIASITVTGSNAADFALTSNCGASLVPSGQCTITVAFKPSSSGSRTASITFADSADGSPQTVSLSGTGIAPAVSLSTANLSFGSQAVAITSAAETVTLTNSGSAPLSVSSLAVVGANVADFAEIANTCGGSVAAGSTCTIGVTFTPSAGGERTAALSLTDSAPGSPQTVGLSGVGRHDVVLSWTPSETSGSVSYNVYRGTASGGESSTPLNATPVNGSTYVDESVTSGATYYYVVTAVTSTGAQSAASGETEATVPAN